MSKSQESINKKAQKISEENVKEYIFERFENVKDTKKIKNLVSFQAMNKYMIMAHDQNELKVLGNIVASYKKNQFLEIIDEYEKHLEKSFGKKPTIKTHSNVIMHIFGYFSKNFSQVEKDQFFEMLKQFREGKITIGNILAEIEPTISRFNSTYLASQTYFLLYSDTQQGNIFNILKNEKIV